MCVIAFKNKNKNISDKTIRSMFTRNPDGCGFMYVRNNKVYWEKGFFNVEEFIERFRACVSDEDMAALHFRIATHGKIEPGLCHPFPLTNTNKLFAKTGSSEVCLMHNGVIRTNEWFSYSNKRDSDTSAYTKRLFYEGVELNVPDENKVKEIEHSIVSDKMIFFDGEGNYKLIGKWQEKDGIFYSNLLFTYAYDYGYNDYFNAKHNGHKYFDCKENYSFIDFLENELK